jgi:hypothetical protein
LTASLLRRSLLVWALCLATALGLTGVAGAASGDPDFLVPVGPKTGGFGPFRGTGSDLTPSDAVDAFGEPDSIDEGDGGCDLRWNGLGIRANFFTFGGGDHCIDGTFQEARLTDERWHTKNGIHPGSSERRTRNYSKRTCRKSTCGATGYALGLFRNECAATKSPTVIATIRESRVKALLVRWRGCE